MNEILKAVIVVFTIIAFGVLISSSKPTATTWFQLIYVLVLAVVAVLLAYMYKVVAAGAKVVKNATKSLANEVADGIDHHRRINSDAIEVLEEEYEKDKSSVTLAYNLVDKLLSLDRISQSKQILHEIRINANDKVCRKYRLLTLYLAYYISCEGDIDKGLDLCNEVIEKSIFGCIEEARETAVRICLEGNRYNKAIEYSLQMGQSGKYKAAIIYMHNLHDYIKAIDILEEITKSCPDNDDANLSLGYCYYKINNKILLEEQYKLLYKRNKHYADELYKLLQNNNVDTTDTNSKNGEYYKILEIPDGANLHTIKQAYRDMVRIWHPDKYTHDNRLKLKAEEKLKIINEAYNVLCSQFA